MALKNGSLTSAADISRFKLASGGSAGGACGSKHFGAGIVAKLGEDSTVGISDRPLVLPFREQLRNHGRFEFFDRQVICAPVIRIIETCGLLRPQ